jgi:ATP synthase subunit 6
MSYSFFDQFEILRLIPFHPFGNFDISITNATVFMFIPLILFIFLFNTNSKDGLVVPGRYQSILEIAYTTVNDMVKENIPHGGSRFFPFILSLFIFLALMNLIGLVPYTFTPTSHGAVSFGLSFSIFIGCTIIAVSKFGIDYFSMFMPAGAPMAMGPFLILIEFISHLAKAISLGLRLAANITAGHLLFAILSSFIWQMMTAGGVIAIVGLFPLAIAFFITILEIGVALIQAYVFCLLTTIYLNDSVHLH